LVLLKSKTAGGCSELMVITLDYHHSIANSIYTKIDGHLGKNDYSGQSFLEKEMKIKWLTLTLYISLLRIVNCMKYNYNYFLRVNLHQFSGSKTR